MSTVTITERTSPNVTIVTRRKLIIQEQVFTPDVATGVLSVNGKVGVVVINKTDVGLGNVDNTSDLNKPISTATQSALDLKANDAEISIVGKTNDYNDLDNKPTIPTVITNHSGLNLDDGTNPHGTTKSDVGLSNVDNTSDLNKPISTATQSALDLKYDSSNPANYVNVSQAAAAAPVQSVSGKTGTVTLDKADVGLGNVDNTSDLNKPISTATQSALDDKVDKVVGKGLSDENYTLTEKNKLAGIEDGAEVNTVDSVNGKVGVVVIDKTDVGLGNVDNTSDLNKPISTATQSALDLKYDASNPSNYVDAAGAAAAAPVQSVNGNTGVVTISVFSGDYNDLTNKPTIPTLTSQLTNDSGYITSSGAPVQSVNGEIGIVVLSAADVGAPSGSGTSTGTNTGDQTITLTGDVTGSGTGTFAATIANDAVTFAKMQNIGSGQLIGRHSSGSGDPETVGIDGGLEYQGSNIRRAALTGAITASAGSNTTALGSFTKSQLDTAISDGNAVYEGDNVADLVLATETTGTAVDFTSGKIFGSSGTPETGNITEDLTSAKLGVVQKIYHNHSVAPTVPAGWVLLGSGTYTLSTLNIIYAEWAGGSRVEYWIIQES